MKKYIILSLIFMLFGCDYPEIPKAIIPPTPTRTESALPGIEKVGDDVVETIDGNIKIGEKINESKQVINEQNISIVEALTQAEKIKEKALAKVAITELEATTLISELKKVQIRNLFLEKQNQELFELKEDQEKILKIIKDTLDKTKDQVINKEHETDELRTQNVFLSTNLTLKNDESEKLKILLQKEKEKSAKASVYRNWVIGLVTSFILWLVIKNVLMLYFPLTKFRI